MIPIPRFLQCGILTLLAAWIPPAGHGQEPLPDGAVLRLGTTRFRHHNRVISLDFSPDGKTLVTADTSWSVCLWDAGTGRLIRRIVGTPPVPRHQVAFLTDGKRVTAADSLGVTIFDAETGAEIRSMAGPPPPDGSGSSAWGALAIHDEGRRVTHLSGHTRKIHTWEIATGEMVTEIECGKVYSRAGIVVYPDGRIAAAGRGEIRIWKGEEEPSRIDGFKVSAMIGMPDGKTLAVCSGPDGVSLIDTTSGERLRGWKAQKMQLRAMACSPDGGRIATLGAEDVLRIWDVKTGTLVKGTDTPLIGLAPGSSGIAFSPDGKRVAAALGSTLTLWEVEGGPVFDEPGHLGGISALTFSPDGKRLASGGGDSTARIWDLETGKEEMVLSHHRGSVGSISFSPDMSHLATAASTGKPQGSRFRLWDLEADPGPVVLHGMGGQYSECRYTPDGRRVVAIAREVANVLEGETGEKIRSVRIPTHGRDQALISPDCFAVAVSPSQASRGERDVQFVDLASGGVVARLPHAERLPAKCLAFSPDGRILVTSQLENVRFWEVYTGDAMGSTREVEKTPYPAAVFSPDGHTVALRFSPRKVDLYDIDADRIRHTIPLPSGTAWALAFSPDGRYLATGMSDTTILLWALPETGRVGRSARGEIEGDPLLWAWGYLADPAASWGHQAIIRLASEGDKAVAFLEDKLLALQTADGEEVKKHVADLDADDFARREAAERALRAMGPSVEGVLREALEGSPSPEMKTRIMAILGSFAARYLPKGGEGLRRLRSVQVLERIASPASARLLEALVRKWPSLREGRAAQGALDRVSLRIP